MLCIIKNSTINQKETITLNDLCKNYDSILYIRKCVLQKIKTELPYDAAISLLDIYPPK